MNYIKIEVPKMTKNLDSKKLKLIEKITSIGSIEEIDDIERFVKMLKLNKEHGHIFKGIQHEVTVEKLKKEQNFKGIDREEFDNLVEELNIQESIEELLSMLD